MDSGHPGIHGPIPGTLKSRGQFTSLSRDKRLTHLFPISTSGLQYSMVPQNVPNTLPGSM